MAQVRLTGRGSDYDMYTDPLTKNAYYFHKPTNKWVTVNGTQTIEVPAQQVLRDTDPDPTPVPLGAAGSAAGPRPQGVNRFTQGLNLVDLSGNESDFDAMARTLLSNYEQQQGAPIAAPIRRRYRELADRLSTLFDLEKAGGEQFDTAQTLGDFFQSLSEGRGNAYSSSYAGGGRRAAQNALNAYNAGESTWNPTARALFGDSDDAQRRQYETLVDALSTDVAPHLRAAMRDSIADIYGRYRAQPATATGNLYTFAKNLGVF